MASITSVAHRVVAGEMLKSLRAKGESVPPDEQHVHGRNLIDGVCVNGVSHSASAERSPTHSKNRCSKVDRPRP